MRISDWSSDVCSSDLVSAWLACQQMQSEGDGRFSRARNGEICTILDGQQVADIPNLKPFEITLESEFTQAAADLLFRDGEGQAPLCFLNFPARGSKILDASLRLGVGFEPEIICPLLIARGVIEQYEIGRAHV